MLRGPLCILSSLIHKSHPFLIFFFISAKHSKGGTCSCAFGLPPLIFDIRLSNALFMVYSLTSFPCHSLAQSQIKLSEVCSRQLYELKRLNTGTDKLQMIIYSVVLESTVCGLGYKTTTQHT